MKTLISKDIFFSHGSLKTTHTENTVNIEDGVNTEDNTENNNSCLCLHKNRNEDEA